MPCCAMPCPAVLRRPRPASQRPNVARSHGICLCPLPSSPSVELTPPQVRSRLLAEERCSRSRVQKGAEGCRRVQKGATGAHWLFWLLAFGFWLPASGFPPIGMLNCYLGPPPLLTPPCCSSGLEPPPTARARATARVVTIIFLIFSWARNLPTSMGPSLCTSTPADPLTHCPSSYNFLTLLLQPPSPSVLSILSLPSSQVKSSQVSSLLGLLLRGTCLPASRPHSVSSSTFNKQEK
ncbi:hypothetical protein N431DRAFT_112593 [Stipitochalara longipes BDJ]|nr:hypothetical protein N431DRAFT_112593 [Stipitochalara longipes BDJ]